LATSVGIPYRPSLDALFGRGTLENAFDIDPRSHDRVGVEFAGLYQLLYFGDGDARGGCHHGVEIACRPAIDQVALAVAFPRLHQCEICLERRLQYIVATIERALFLALSDQGAHPGGGVEGGDARPAGADALRQRALRNQCDFERAGNDQFLQQRVFAHIASDVGSDHARLEHQPEAKPVHAHVV
jgi:hypothetical protein